ncbi:hypothetical protein EVAR_89743_1 [Eumeta japonica]|uniref:Uncharacterized protein n=1 Tax=Eumeta variegata TaxID=151549 RepID=A0A4C1Y3G8_EUMVA|nr:hypothetical protein EVAR_89743_1 [Eumeta japonica]
MQNSHIRANSMLWPIWLQHGNEPVRPVKYYTLTRYRCEVAVSSVAFPPVSESFGDPHHPHHSISTSSVYSPSYRPTTTSIEYLFPVQEAGVTVREHT